MTTNPLPEFPYHPDPVGTGSVQASDAECECCNRARGFIYVGPVYAEEELDGAICPWCIADGSAHEKFDAEFTDSDGVGDYGSWDSVPSEVVREVATRTPGFSGWQQERWFTCCGDAAAFIGRAGHAELVSQGPDAVGAIQEDCGLEGDEWDAYFKALQREDSPTAYVFRCRVCHRFGGYSDCD